MDIQTAIDRANSESYKGNRFMLWFDATPNKPVTQKIAGGITYYRLKYQGVVNHVLVNPNDYPGIQPIEGVFIEPCKLVMPCHFLLGVNHGSR